MAIGAGPDGKGLIPRDTEIPASITAAKDGKMMAEHIFCPCFLPDPSCLFMAGVLKGCREGILRLSRFLQDVGRGRHNSGADFAEMVGPLLVERVSRDGSSADL